jgi:hypothetical protein
MRVSFVEMFFANHVWFIQEVEPDIGSMPTTTRINTFNRVNYWLSIVSIKLHVGISTFDTGPSFGVICH